MHLPWSSKAACHFPRVLWREVKAHLLVFRLAGLHTREQRLASTHTIVQTRTLTRYYSLSCYVWLFLWKASGGDSSDQSLLLDQHGRNMAVQHHALDSQPSVCRRFLWNKCHVLKNTIRSEQAWAYTHARIHRSIFIHFPLLFGCSIWQQIGWARAHTHHPTLPTGGTLGPCLNRQGEQICTEIPQLMTAVYQASPQTTN